jgi:hypothetical protein
MANSSSLISCLPMWTTRRFPYFGKGTSFSTISMLDYLLGSTTVFENFDHIVLSGDTGSGLRQTETLYSIRRCDNYMVSMYRSNCSLLVMRGTCATHTAGTCLTCLLHSR